ncbi:ankyrin-2 isoform X5 [Drosophila albomicans]|uniref:Ankyrin-2 isoform X5 n=1 Tax=Drosophila albomicans TaxID=7291 RepID=A0A9C6SYN2_DROAB|nr:ankyrin-2 isoform X5 [Drosophila albomicans]
MAQFVTHIQPTLLEASQGHVPHHHGHQVGVQHSSHLPHSGHNMPSPPTAHNHHHGGGGGHGNSSSHHHHKQPHSEPHHAEQQHQQHQQPHSKKSHHATTHHGNPVKSHPHQSPPSAVSSPPGEHVGHYDYFQHQHELAFQHHGEGATPTHGSGNNKHHDKHEHCPTGHQSAGDGNTSFLRAARAGNLERVLEHLKNNIDINTSNANGLNALHLASKDGHIHVVSELLRRGAIVDSATKKGNTALHIASLAGQEEVVKLLLEHNASVNVQSQNGFTPLYMAAQENHDAVVRLLLSNGANQSLATEDGFTPLAVAMQQGHDKVVAVLLESDTRGKVRLPALHIAAKKDDVKAATLLLDNDHNPDVTSKSGFTPLHIASHYGNQNIANLLIQKGADVNYSAKHNISPLHVAAKWGKTNMVSLLLEKGGNIEAKTRDGLTPLHCAARSGHEQVVDMLLERGAPISAKTKNGLAPLHMAAQGEHVDAARILLYHRAPVDEVTVDYLTALHVAAHCGHVRVAKLLLDRNADANARALNGFTPLHIACKKNRLKVVELLLRHGASISATTESGLTPLHVAAFMGCMNIVIYLLQHDASPDVPTVRGETPLHLAARANQTDIIRILLRNGAQVDARAREQQTPLHIASRLGNVDIVMLLLQHGAQVDATTKDMYTALHIAAKEGQDEVAAVLIENGAALDAATKKGFTPLHLTAKYGHIKVAQLLLQKEADVDAQGKNGVTPLHVACHYNNQQVALLLLEKGASPHATAKNGHTPLHIAARKNQMDIATTLLEYGAQANAESKAGFTPLHLSSQEGHAEISNLLIEHKAAVNHPAKNGLTPMHLCAQEDNVNVAEILQRNGANIDMATKAGYTPLHVASHFGQANMVRFLLQNGANIDMATKAGYTPLHQTAQQGHCHIVNLLLEHKANANAQTVNGQTPLHIARKLGYISVLDSLKSITKEDEAAAAPAQTEEKYRVVAPEAMHESFMSDSEEEGGDTNWELDACYEFGIGVGQLRSNPFNAQLIYQPYYQGDFLYVSSEDNMLSDQPYRYLTVDEMKSLGDDSLPIDVTRDERMDSNRMTQSAEYASGVPPTIGEEMISPHKAQVYGSSPKATVDGVYIANGNDNDEPPHVGRKLSWKSFLVSFLVDARGGAMRGCRHSGVRMIIPSRSTCQPTRVTCRYVKPQRTMHPPQLMEGEALASRVLELGPCSTKFIGPVVMEVPHFASLRGKEREIIILRSDNGETWREHTIDNSEEIIHDVMQQCFEPEEIAQLEEQAGNHVCRFVTYDFPQYFAVVSRIRQEVHAIGPEGGMVSSTVVPQVQAVFPQGALTKKIKVGLQAQPVDPDLTAKLLGRGVAVSPIVTVEPRRRKFHKAITLSMPAPKAHSQGMINQYSGNTPTLRLLCSITGVFRKRSLKGGPSRAQWEDVTGSTPLTFVNDCVSFTTTVSARFWLMDCRNISDATKMATELYKEVIHVPFIARFVVFAKKIEPFEARLRVFCMTDDREDKTLEKHELYTEVAKSRDVEVLEGKPQYIEMAGNLVPVTKSGDQLQLQFKAFRENRLPFTVRVKDQHADIVGRTLFMKEPKVAKGEPPQQPICILNIVLPEAVIPDSTTAFSERVSSAYRTSMFSLSKHQNDHYIGDIRIVDLSNLLGKDWIQLAPEIGITTDEIDEIINHNTDSIARQAQSMIRLYKDKPNYEILALETALKNIGRDDIMKKCKSGRLSHSREFDEADLMKNSESVEELVRRESKRIQQINEREEVKYSAEEKEIEESESDEEQAKRTVAERREKIVKRLSMERSIPASTQKKEITREITEIKRKSLIEDKKAHHESEILMQLPADNVIIKTASVPDQVIKMKMGKMDSTEISKTDFDKELTHKLKTSGRSSEEEELPSPEKIDKIVQDISTAEKTSKDTATTSRMASITRQEARDITEDFLEFEKRSQLPASTTPTSITVHEKFVEEFKEKTSPVAAMPQETIKEVEQVISEVTETASKKVENIISSFESGKQEIKEEIKEQSTEVVSETKKVSETIKHLQDAQSLSMEQVSKTVEIVESTKIDEKIADFEAKKVKYDFHGGEPKTQIPKLMKKPSEEPLKPTAAPRATAETVEVEKPAEAKVEKPISKIPVKTGMEIDARKMTQDFLQSEQKTQLAAEPKAAPAASKIPKVEPRKSVEKLAEKDIKVFDDIVTSTATIMTSGMASELPKEQAEVAAKGDTVTEKVTELIDTFHKIEEKVTKTEKPAEIASKLEEDLISVQPKEDKVAEKVAEVVETFHKIEEQIVLDSHKLTHDFLSMEQQSQLPSMPPKTETATTSEPETVISLKPAVPASKIPQPTSTAEILPKSEIAAKAETVTEKLTDLIDTFHTIEEKITTTEKPAEKASIIPIQQEQPKEDKVAEKVAEVVETFHKIEEKIVLDTHKITHDFLSMEQQSQLPSMPQTTEKIIMSSQTSTTSEPESVISVKQAAPASKIPQPTTTTETDSVVTAKPAPPASKIPVVEPRKSLVDEAIKPAAPKAQPLNERQLTEDFLNMEQQTQLPAQPIKSTVSELIINTANIETTILPEDVQPQEATIIKKVEHKPAAESQLISGDGIESAAPIGEVSPFATRKMTADFLAMEQQTQLSCEYDSDTFGKRATVPLSETITKDEGLVAPLSIEPRKSLTDAEFCKYVGDTITKKMSEGLIEMTDELKQIASDIPHSQTPPPTPSDAKTEKQTEQPDHGSLERDYLADTVTTLHSTTESTFERVSAISTIEGLTKTSIEPVSIQHTVQISQQIGDDVKVGDDHDDGDGDDGRDDDRDDAFDDRVARIREEAKILVDHVLEESVDFIESHGEQTNGLHDSIKHEYNSESDNYAITCDDIGGVDVIKSPTIESMSGKSFDDNMSFTDEHIHLPLHAQNITATTTTTTVTTQIQQQQQLSQQHPQQQPQSLINVAAPSTVTAKETGGDIPISTDTTPIPTQAAQPPTAAEPLVETNTITTTTSHDTPTPKPRVLKASSPVSMTASVSISDGTDSTTIPTQVQQPDLPIDISIDAAAPVPKPRAPIKHNEQFENLAALGEQSDSISLRSFDFTDELSKTDEPSTELSIRSQQRDVVTTATATTTASEDHTESFEPTSEISVDDADTEKSDGGEKATSFYIGESSRNVITKTSTAKSPSLTPQDEEAKIIEAKDICLMKEVSVDSDEANDAFKEFVTMKPDDSFALDSKIVRQGSETRNDILEFENVDKEKSTDAKMSKVTTEESLTTSTGSSGRAVIEIAPSSSEDPDESSKEIPEIVNTIIEKQEKFELPLEKSEWEISEKEIPAASKPKVVHSPQQPQESMTKSVLGEALVGEPIAEVQETAELIKKEFKLSTEPQETFSAAAEPEDLSSFIGIPDMQASSIDSTQPPEGLFDTTIRETLNKQAAMAHYAKDVFGQVERRDDHGSLGFVSTGTAEDFSSMEEHLAKEEQGSLGFISTETAEDFSSMEDYYTERLATASVVAEESVADKSSASAFEEVVSDQSIKPVDLVVHRIKTDSSPESMNRWSIPDVDNSSSSESYHKSFEKSQSRPLSSDVENLLTGTGTSSEYQTAMEFTSTCRDGTEYMSAVSTLRSSSGKSISSHESMRSLDSQSETSANLASIDVSELSETLVASSTEADALEAEEMARLHDLRADDDDSDESLDMAASAYPSAEQQSLMKRSQEMIFKPKSESDVLPQQPAAEAVQIEEYPKPKETERTWGLAYPMDEKDSKIDSPRDSEKGEDILLYHGDARRSIDESKLASSLDEGSILSVSMSSTSNIDTVVENFEDIIGSAGSSSLTGIEGFQYGHDEMVPSASLPEDTTFVLEMESKEHSPQDSNASTPPGGESKRRGHKRNESTTISGDALKNVDKDAPSPGEGKESESESDTDPYESEYARQFRSPKERKNKKKKQAAAEMDHSAELEKRPFTPSQLVAEVIVEDATEELEAEAAMIEERRPSQNMQDYSNIPDIMVTEHVKSPIEEESDEFPEKSLYKVRTEEELNKASDVEAYKAKAEEKELDFQRRVQEQYKQKLEELKRAEIGADYDDHRAADSPDSFEMVEQPDISDEFVIIEEVAKEANEVDLGGKSIKIKPTKYEQKHDEDVEKIIIKSAPADPKLGSQLYKDDLNFEFEESPPTGASSSSEQPEESDSSDTTAANKRWVEMQLTDTQLRYPYDLTGAVLEDIKEEDGEFEVGSSRISSFKDSFSSTPEYDLAARRYHSRGEHDDVSMSSLQEFESLEQAISLENRNRGTHQGSTDSSNGSFTRRYIVRHSGSGAAPGDDVSISSLKDFEGLENACIEAHLIEIKAKEEAALLSRSDESNKSNGSENGAVGNVVVTKVTRTVTRTEVVPSGQAENLELLLKQQLEREESDAKAGITTVKGATDIVSSELEGKSKIDSQDSEKDSIDSMEIRSHDMMTSSIESFDISKDATTRSDIDSLEIDKRHSRQESIESFGDEQMDLMSKLVSGGGVTLGDGLTTTTTTTTTSTDADGQEHTVTRVITTTTVAGGIQELPMDESYMSKDLSVDSLNLCIEQTTSSAGTTATYQTSAGNSQMSGSVTSCASSTLMEDSFPGVGGMSSSQMSASFWSHDESTVVEDDDPKTTQQQRQ